MCGAFQAAEHSGKPIAIVGEEASAGLLEAVREKGGQATQYLRDAIQGVTRAVEEYAAKLRDMASEVAERGRQALQGVIDRLKASSSS
jgi:phage tail tape-measure protein